MVSGFELGVGHAGDQEHREDAHVTQILLKLGLAESPDQHPSRTRRGHIPPRLADCFRSLEYSRR